MRLGVAEGADGREARGEGEGGGGLVEAAAFEGGASLRDAKERETEAERRERKSCVDETRVEVGGCEGATVSRGFDRIKGGGREGKGRLNDRDRRGILNSRFDLRRGR